MSPARLGGVVLAATLLPALPAGATPSFDPAAPAAVFEGDDPRLVDGDGVPTWDRVERLVDGEARLFRQEDFAPGSAWDDDSPLSPHAAELFGDPTPPSSTALLHMAPGWLAAEHPVPILLVSGASTSASGVLAALARQLAARGRSVFALSFAHPHGDCFQQAEQIANALLRIEALTGAAQVDLVAHSKGGIAAAVYLANRPGADWGDHPRAAAYADWATPYRGDVRRFVPVAVPFGGLDTTFRWTAPHLEVVSDGADPLAPLPWDTWYPFGTANLLVSDDVRALNVWPDGADAFPGTAQLLRRWDEAFPLPGERPELGAFALQTDWASTYEGTLGFFSRGAGIDDAIATAGGLLDHLASNRLPAGVPVAVLAGTFPFIALDRPAITVDPFGADASAFPGQDDAFYGAFYDAVLAADFPDVALDADDLQGLRSGWLVPGEISGLSDGVVFTASVLEAEALLADGEALLDARTAQLSHLDLLFASPELGAAMVAQGSADPDRAYLRALGQRWIDEDTVGWIAGVLADEPPGDDDDSAAGDDDDSADDDDASDDDDSGGPDGGDDDDSVREPPFLDGCGCAQGGSAGGLLGLLPAFLRRRR